MKPFLTIGCPEVILYEDFVALVETPNIEVNFYKHFASVVIERIQRS